MARRIGALDWSATPLGPIGQWPQSLRTVVDLMLASPGMMSLVWGAEATHLYNDSFTELLREQAVASLGRSAFATFARSRDVFAADIAAGMAGRSVRLSGQRYPVLRDGELQDAWFHVDYAPVRDETGAVGGVLWTLKEVTAQRIAEQALREREEGLKVLVAELQHRTRNLMAVVRVTADRTGERSTDIADFRERFGARLEALGRVQALLSRLNDADRIAFDELVRTELSAMHGSGERVTLDGPGGIRLRSSMVQTLAMAIHELATNAVKYGALGQPGGRLSIAWRLIDHEQPGGARLRIEWRESGVTMPPAGDAPQGGGEGRTLIEQALPYQLGAETSFVLGPDGVRCTIVIPVSTR